MKTALLRIALLLGSFAVCFVLAELLYRAIGASGSDEKDLHARYEVYYQDQDRTRVQNLAAAIPRGMAVPEPTAPRPRYKFAPDRTFYLCYSGLDDEAAAYFDAQGCVACRMNSLGLREREAVCGPKPEGQRRVLCLGDSFTFGWGVKVEDAWPRRVERRLREAGLDGVRTVNAGAAGAIYVDEYRAALEERLHVVDPDVLLVTLCLNDLLPTSHALAHQRSTPWLLRRSHLLRDLVQAYDMQAALTIDPERDLVQELLDLPAEVYPAIPWLKGVERADLWPGGGVQRDLLAMRDWCRERGVAYGVAIWPYFQGLGPDEHYPFERIHELVGAFCTEHEIPFLDVLPELRGAAPTAELWVSPADYHGNARAHALATPAIAAFVRGLLGED